MSSGHDLEPLVQRIGTTSDHQSHICVETPHLKALALDWMDAYAAIGRITRRCERQEAQVARLQAALLEQWGAAHEDRCGSLPEICDANPSGCAWRMPSALAPGEPEPTQKRYCDGVLCFNTENLRAYMLPRRSAPIMACLSHAPDAERIIAEDAAGPSAEPSTEK